MRRYIADLIYRMLSFRVRNNHMTMLSGAKMYVFRPWRSDELLVADLAKAKANLCRWGGNLPRFYSVAQHSVYAYRIAKANGEPWAVQFMYRRSPLGVRNGMNAAPITLVSWCTFPVSGLYR